MSDGSNPSSSDKFNYCEKESLVTTVRSETDPLSVCEQNLFEISGSNGFKTGVNFA